MDEGGKTPTVQELGTDVLSVNGLNPLMTLFAHDADIVLLGCQVGTNQKYLDDISHNLRGLTVYAPKSDYDYTEETQYQRKNGKQVITGKVFLPFITPESDPADFAKSK